MATGTLYIVSAPSGAGKSSLINALLADIGDKAKVSVSHTTRAPRPGEVDGTHYYFTNQEEFKKLISEDTFLEYAQVFDNFYGTSKTMIEKELAAGIDVFLDIDWQGAQQIRKKMPSVKSIFILPPSLPELEKRLTGRGQDSAEVIAHRMDKAIAEMEHFDEYDYLIINDNFDAAVAQLKAILLAEKVKISYQKVEQQSLITKLLAK